MFRFCNGKIAALAVVVVLVPFAQPAASAQARSEASADLMQVDLLAQAKHILSEVWTKIGCTLDPDGIHGLCVTGQVVPQPRVPVSPRRSQAPADPISAHPKIGCGLDPNGITLCEPSKSQARIVVTPAHLGIGCTIDPDGSSCIDQQ